VIERRDGTQIHLTAANRHGPQRIIDSEGHDTALHSTVDVNNAHAVSDSINDDRPLQTADQYGQQLDAIVARRGQAERQHARQSNPITADGLDSAERRDKDLAVIVTRSGVATASTAASASDTNRARGSGERGNKQGNKRGQQDQVDRRDCSAAGAASRSDTVTLGETPNNPVGDDLSGVNRIKPRKLNDMTECRDAETDLHRKFNELSNIDMSDVNYESEQTDALGDSENFQIAQRQCKTLEHLWTRARAGSSELKIIGGLLYKKIPVNITSTNEYALIVPQVFRHELITLAHDNITDVGMWDVGRRNRGLRPISTGHECTK